MTPIATAEYAISVGYPPGTMLRDVTLAEARAMECNRCGDCCDTTSEHVRTDPEVGLPLFVWDKPGHDAAFELPEDRYEKRYGRPLIRPVIRGDGGLVVARAFEVDRNGNEHRSFQCAALMRVTTLDGEEKPATCSLYGNRGDDDPNRPYNCGAFPVYGMEAEAALLNVGEYIPHTSALPRCTWHGLRIVGEAA